MDWLFTLLGIAIVLVGLVDVFQTLLHPSGQGSLSRLVVRSVWWISRQFKHRMGTFTGPVAIVSIMGFWAIIQIIGWAMIYYPHIPQGFSYSFGIFEFKYADFAEAIYISLVTLGTLGYGDVVPVDHWIRLVSPLQALTGFALLTAAVSWFMQIYPALAQRRALALRLTHLQDTGYVDRLPDIDGIATSQLLTALTEDIVKVRVQYTQNSETYYFREANREISFPAVVSYGLDLCEAACRSEHAGNRANGAAMKGALDDLAGFFKKQYSTPGETTKEVFEAFASDHGHRS